MAPRHGPQMAPWGPLWVFFAKLFGSDPFLCESSGGSAGSVLTTCDESSEDAVHDEVEIHSGVFDAAFEVAPRSADRSVGIAVAPFPGDEYGEAYLVLRRGDAVRYASDEDEDGWRFGCLGTPLGTPLGFLCKTFWLRPFSWLLFGPKSLPFCSPLPTFGPPATTPLFSQGSMS